MDFEQLEAIRAKLDEMKCLSYELVIKFEDNNAIVISRKEAEKKEERTTKVGFI